MTTSPDSPASPGPATATWNPPGAGTWICDRSHGRPGFTRLYRRIASEHTAPTYRRALANVGGAVDTIDMQFVNGSLYRRIVPLVAADRDNGRVPPKLVVWLLSRLHPEFRRREKQSRRTLAGRTFLDEIRVWNGGEREQWRAANLALQATDPSALDDAALAHHLQDLDRHLVKGWCRHHLLHVSDLGPIGDLMAHAVNWKLDPVAVMGLLRGSSPATVEAAAHGAAMADALRAGGVDPARTASVDEIRAVPGAATALDAYRAEFGWRVVSDYDIEGLTLNELPGAVCALVRRAATQPTEPEVPAGPRAGAEAELRSRCPEPALFDELLDSARQAYGLRDDNGPLTWEWPVGLTRRAYLEAGDRLARRDRLHQADHVFELDIPELAALLTGTGGPADPAGPDAVDAARRADHRRWEAGLTAPDVLGPAPAEPDLSPLPPGLRRTMGIILAATSMLEPDPARTVTALHGLGIGTRSHVGRARVADDPNRALQEMEPGDVLVAPWTAPSYNAVLSIAGAVVVQEGGLLCHAAVMARELDLPAVIGCAEAMTGIRSGDLVEVDPVAGAVRVLDPATTPEAVPAGT